MGPRVFSGCSQHNQGHLLGAHLLPQAGVGVIPGWSPQYSSLWDPCSLISALPAPPTPTPQRSSGTQTPPDPGPVHLTDQNQAFPLLLLPAMAPGGLGPVSICVGPVLGLCRCRSEVTHNPGAAATRPAILACDRLGPHWVCSPQTPSPGDSEAELLPQLLRSVSTQRRCAPVTSAPRHPGHVLVGTSAAGSSFPGEPGTTRAWRHEEAGM